MNTISHATETSGMDSSLSRDEGLDRAAKLLNAILWRLAVAILVSGAVVLLVVAEKGLFAVFCAAALALLFGSHVLNRRGHSRPASVLLVGGMWLLITVFVMTAGGMRGLGPALYVALSVITALLLGWRAANVTVGLSLLVGLALAVAESVTGGHLPRLFELPPLAGWAVLAFSVAMAIGSVNMALRDLAAALTLSRARLVERQQLADTLQQSETQLRLIFENSRDAIGVARAGLHLLVNPAYLEMFGYERAEELLGTPILNLIAPSERARVGQYVAMRAQEEPAPTEYVTRGLRKNGEEFDLEVTSSVYMLRGERHTLAILRDISQRKATEAAVRQSEALLRLVTDNMTDGITYVDAAGRLVYISPSVSRVYGYELHQLADNRGFDLIHPEDRDRLVAAFDAAQAATGAPTHVVCRYRHANGDYRWLEFSINSIFDPPGQYAGAVIASRDITERKRAEDEVRRLNAELEQRVQERTAQLQEANQELEAFSYSVSHDLRAPLRSLDGFSRTLLEEYGDWLDATAIHYLEVIRNSATHMGHLIDDLLSFSRLSRQPLTKIHVDMTHLVRQALANLEAERSDRQVEVVIDPLPECQGDRALLFQVWMNLISNALKFTRKRALARIEIGSQAGARGETVYFVRDNGAGFDMRYADKLFGVFQRLHPASEYEGAGVGLAIVKRIVSRHGGRIWAEGRVDEGAVFYFTVADADAPATPAGENS